MITYNRSAFGLNLIFRVHGSAVYRSFIPSLVAVICYFIIRETMDTTQYNEDLGHPYAIGLLVSSTTFLVVFRANNGYNRYWEACTATHHLLSKWLDATTHMAIYHLQCDHYLGIKPPSYFEHPELNQMFLTRDRERGAISTSNKSEDPRKKESSRNDSANVSGNLEEYVKIATAHREQLSQNHKRVKRMSNGQIEREVRSVTKSINYVKSDKKFNKLGLDRHQKPSMEEELEPEDDLGEASEKFKFVPGPDEEPFPLHNTPRLDGNFGKLFDDDLATFFDPKNPDNIDPAGFASTQGGRTPALFLQELAHLSSLMTAVALSTLRNDVEGAESPLTFYEPGSPWPEVDPDKDEIWKVTGFTHLVRMIKDFLGIARSPEERTKYNAARPLSVIGGVSDAEIRFLQTARGPLAKTQLCWQWFSEFCIREHLAGSTGKVGPPIISRVIQFLGDGMIYYNHARKIMFIPFPFVHAQLSVVFILVMIPAIAFLMDQYTESPWIGSILTFASVLCLSGINEVAREMENPFRNIPNELPLVTIMAQFNEALLTMYAGFHPDHYFSARKAMKHRGYKTPAQKKPMEQAETTKGPFCSSKEKRIGEENKQELDDTSASRAEIEALKKQLADQAKLIEQLASKIQIDPIEETKHVDKIVNDNMLHT